VRFLLYDRIIEMEPGKRALATKLVTISDEYLDEHYGRRAQMPGTLVIESLAQVGGWLNLVSRDFSIRTVLGLIEGASLFRPVRPGDTLTLEVWMLYTHADGATVRGSARVGAQPVAVVDRILFVNQTVQDPAFSAEQRERFQYLSGGYTDPQETRG
jgi:3-hydroxyacyl-[acyl-carrier-protein] dehydratase